METTVKSKKLFEMEEIPEELYGVKLSPVSRELLSDGKWSELIEGMVDGENSLKNAKIKLSRAEDGGVKVNFQYQQERLVIPDRIGEYKLTDEDKRKLSDNELTGPIPYKQGTIYLQVDNELNSVVVKTSHDLNVAQIIQAKHEKNGEFSISGYKLTDEEVRNLTSGKELGTKVYSENGQYFAAKISLTPELDGIKYREVQTLTAKQAEELKAKLNEHKSPVVEALAKSATDISKENAQNLTKEVEPQQHKENGKLVENLADSSLSITSEKGNVRSQDVLEKEFESAVEKRDFVKLNELKEEGFKPNPERLDAIGKDHNLSDQDKIAVREVFDLAPAAPAKDEKAQDLTKEVEPHQGNTKMVENLADSSLSITAEKGNARSQEVLEKEFESAVEKRDFVKLNELKEEGFKPNPERLDAIGKDHNLSDQDKIAIREVFDLAPAAPAKDEKAQDLTKGTEQGKALPLGVESKQQKEKEEKGQPGQTTQKVKDMLNQGFANME